MHGKELAMALALIQRIFDETIRRAQDGVGEDPNKSRTTAYDSSCVLKLIAMMKARDIFGDKQPRFTSVVGIQPCVQYNQAELKRALVARPECERFKTKFVEFTICGDFGADHDDVEALILLCNLCGAYPHWFKISRVSCSNIVDAQDRPINHKCIEIARAVCYMLLPDYMFENISFITANNTPGTSRKKLLHPILYDMNFDVFSEFKRPTKKNIHSREVDELATPPSAGSLACLFRKCYPKIYPSKTTWRKCIVSISSAAVPDKLLTPDAFVAAMGLIDHSKLEPWMDEISMQNVPFDLEFKQLEKGDNYNFDVSHSQSLLRKIAEDNVRCLFLQKGLAINRLDFEEGFPFPKYFSLTYKIAVMNVVRQWFDEPDFGKFPQVKAHEVHAFADILQDPLREIINRENISKQLKVEQIIRKLRQLR